MTTTTSMADIEVQLSRELTRVISCSYPASLAKLADILAIAPADLIQGCVNDRPRWQIPQLASIVATALPLWPYSLQLLQHLCHSPEFRNSLLLQHPAILNTLLTRANGSPHDFDKYAEICVLLLSQPLPDTVQLPEAALRFFLSVFDSAVQSPGVQTLRPIYSILNGAGRGLLSVISVDDQHRFDRELCQILSSHSAGQDSLLLLWCIGIVLLVEQSQDAASRFHTMVSGVNWQVSTPAHQKEWRTASGRKLFGSPKWLLKTINLTYLSVIWATKGDVGFSDAEAVEGIAIATRVLQLVDRDTRERWPTSNDLARGSFPKLPSKILRTGINATVQLEAMCFYAMIVGEKNIPADMVTRYEDILLDVPKLNLEANRLQETLRISLQLFAAHLHETTLRSLLSRLLDTGVVDRSSQVSKGLLALTKELISAIPTCPPLQRQLLLALSKHETQQSVQSFLSTRIQSDVDIKAPLRNTIADAECQNLISNILTMLLTVVFTATDASKVLPPQLVISLLAKQQQMSCTSSHSPHSNVHSPQQSVSLFQQECTPATETSTTDWRGKLQSELKLQGSYSMDSLVRSVAQICHGLELRCENVEEPLRREQEKTEALKGQISQLHGQVTALQSELVDQKLYNEGLEAENSSIDNEKERYSEKLRELTIQLDDVNTRADETLREVQDQFHATELQLRSLIISHEKSLLTRGKELEEAQDSLAHFKSSIQQMERTVSELSGNNEALKAKLTYEERELVSERRNGACQAEELGYLKSNVADLEGRLSNTSSDLQNKTKELIEIRDLHHNLKESSAKALQDLEAKYEKSMEVAVKEAAEEYDRLDEELRIALEGQQQLKSAHDSTRRELHFSQKAVGVLEAKALQLTTTCSEKDAELVELRSIKHHILASLGLSNVSALPVRNGHQVHEDANAPRTPSKQHRRQKSAVPTEDLESRGTISTQGVTGTAIENIANASFTSSESSRNGPTPKRAKPRPTFKIPTMHTPYGQKVASKVHARRSSPSKRSALKAMSPNRRHTTVGFALSHNEEGDENGDFGKRRGSFDAAEQTSFDMEGLVAGTPFTPGNIAFGTGREPDGEEETTEL